MTGGQTSTYELQFQTKKLGVAHWSVCVFDPDTDVGCGQAVTTIAG